MMKKPRHKWHTLTAEETAQLVLVLPPRPTRAARPHEGEFRLQKCERCDWYRLEDRSPRGAEDWWYYRVGYRYFNWASYYITGRPRCGEKK